MSSLSVFSPVLALIAATQVGGCQPIQKVIADSQASKARMEELTAQHVQMDAKIQAIKAQQGPEIATPAHANQRMQLAKLELEQLDGVLKAEAEKYVSLEKQLVLLRQEIEKLKVP